MLSATTPGGGSDAVLLGQPLLTLVLLVALNIGFDLKAHLREHDWPRPVARDGPGPAH